MRLSFVVAAMLLVPTVSFAQLPEVDALVTPFLEAQRIPGVAIGIMKGDKVIYARGFGFADLEARTPMTTRSAFHIASLTKQFTAMAVLTLADQGKLRLSERLGTYFDELPAGPASTTVLQLLNHTSGLEFPVGWAKAYEQVDPTTGRRDRGEATKALLGAARVTFPPGKQFRYSNQGFQLAGLLIERVSGVSYATFLQQHIFAPLKMGDTSYLDETRALNNRAFGYTERDGVVQRATNSQGRGQLFAAGAVESTVADLLTWQMALRNNGMGNVASFDRMTAPGKLTNGTDLPYGLGLFLLNADGTRKIDHYGISPGFRSHLAYYPESQLTIVVLANMSNARTIVLENRIALRLLGKPEPRFIDTKLTEPELQVYVGRYDVGDAPISQATRTIPVVIENMGLVIDDERVGPLGPDMFAPLDDPFRRYTFIRRDGRVQGLRLERNGFTAADAKRMPAAVPQ